tara:strand:- start:3108 stop:4553 length:1446 start_codon:yes stop_codon:yes gene_type:complete
MNKIYTHLYSLGNSAGTVVQKFVNRKDDIVPRELNRAVEFMEKLMSRGEFNSKNIDNLLLEDAKSNQEKLDSFLCLRCKVSYFISNYIKKLYKDNSGSGISLNEMALITLTDYGSSYFKVSINEANKKAFKEIESSLDIKKKIRKNIIFKSNFFELKKFKEIIELPLSFQILLTYNIKKGSIQKWSNLKTQNYGRLKSYLNEYKVKIESKWVFLAYRSEIQIKKAFNFYDGDGNLEYVLKLFNSYKENYELLEGKTKKWIPDDFFIEKLNPKQKNKDNLEKLISALRKSFKNLSIDAPLSKEDNQDLNETQMRIFDKKELLKLDAEIIRLIDSYIPNIYGRFLDIKFRKEIELFIQFPERKKIWKMYCDGLSQREISRTLGCNQTRVSRILNEKVMFNDITNIFINKITNKENKKQIEIELEKAFEVNNMNEIYKFQSHLDIIKIFNPLIENNKEYLKDKIAQYICFRFYNEIRGYVKKII